MARWAGWGAGPAGAGSAGGPSRFFLVLALAGSLVVAGILARDHRLGAAAVAAGAGAYFALRLLGVIGGRRGP